MTLLLAAALALVLVPPVYGQAHPVVDHHQHLFSPTASVLVSPAPRPQVELPADLDSLIKARSGAAQDSSALRDLYTDDAWLVRSSNPTWVRGRDAVIAAWIQSTQSRIRLTPLGWQITGSAGYVTAYLTEGEGDSLRHTAHVLMSIRKDPGTRWRIAAEALTPGPTKIGPISARDVTAHLDAAGIRRAVVLSLAYTFGSANRPPPENEYAKVRAENDYTAQQVALYPDRLRAFCSFNPLKDYALEELARCAKDPQLRSGLKLHIGNSGVNYHDAQHVAQVRRVFEAANRYRMPIVIHMRASNSRRLPYGRDEARTFIEQILPGAPDIPVQIAHLAGSGGWDTTTDQALSAFVDAIERKAPTMRRIYFDVTTVVVDLSLEEAALVAKRLRQLGMQRILYGSDAAAGGNLPPRQGWTAFRQLPLSEAEFRTIANNVAPYLRQ